MRVVVLVLFYALTPRTAVLRTAAPPRGRPTGRGACALLRAMRRGRVLLFWVYIIPPTVILGP